MGFRGVKAKTKRSGAAVLCIFANHIYNSLRYPLIDMLVNTMDCFAGMLLPHVC